MKALFSFCLFFSITCLYAGINFERIALDHALEKAKSQNKLIFVDNYASWCAPCKVMDKVFRQQHVGNYFNQDFINVKIDMDGSQGPIMQNRYGVVWLPTLLILNESGEVLMKLDKVVTAGELIDYANEARTNQSISDQRGLSSNPFPEGSSASNSQDYDPNDKEEVIYVYDDRVSSGRPHIMFHEAYLHLQLSDGKHNQVVQRYLSTQTDWSTDKNIRFIFDFLEDVNSGLFEYFLKNRLRFEEVVGKEKVRESLGHIINQRIEQGYPRPELKEYVKLFQLLDPENGEQIAYKKYLARMDNEGEQIPYINAASKYISDINSSDHEVMYTLVDKRQSRSDKGKYLDQDITLLSEAIILSPEDHRYHSLLSKLYVTKGEDNKAVTSLEDAILYAPDNMKAQYQSQLAQIKGL